MIFYQFYKNILERSKIYKLRRNKIVVYRQSPIKHYRYLFFQLSLYLCGEVNGWMALSPCSPKQKRKGKPEKVLLNKLSLLSRRFTAVFVPTFSHIYRVYLKARKQRRIFEQIRAKNIDGVKYGYAYCPT